MMYNMLYKSDMAHLGTADFRKAVSDTKLRQLLETHGVIGIGRYAQTPAAVVVEPKLFADLAESKEHLESLKTTLPLLLAAARTGTAIPSETLSLLGFDQGDDGWRALNEFQASFPVTFTANEDGGPVTRARFSPQPRLRESDDEYELVDD